MYSIRIVLVRMYFSLTQGLSAIRQRLPRRVHGFQPKSILAVVSTFYTIGGVCAASKLLFYRRPVIYTYISLLNRLIA